MAAASPRLVERLLSQCFFCGAEPQHEMEHVEDNLVIQLCQACLETRDLDAEPQILELRRASCAASVVN